MQELPSQITVDGATLTLSVQRKQVKNVNAKLRGSTLSVSAPLGMADKELEAAVHDLARRLLRRAHAQRVNAEEETLALATNMGYGRDTPRFGHKLGD